MYKNRSYCGELGEKDIGKKVMLAGWVDRKRDLGGIIFIELRDVSGILQIVFDSSQSGKNAEIADKTRSEYVIKATGTIRKRSDDTINPNLPTGSIEAVADSIEILNASLVPPFPIDARETLNEEVRLRYRFLDLRREGMKEALITRHIISRSARKYLSENRFLEIETPILNKSTPEGARDFLVPSRINRGEFYALPQSPQLFKQILMIAGYDRYFQIVKCFRDEDLRNDRQPEFTQIDLEMSFITQDMIMEIIERLLTVMVKDTIGKDIATPFTRITYDEAMAKYGTDAPDLRFGLEIGDASDIFAGSEFKVFADALSNGGVIRGFAVPDNGKISRKMIDEYMEYVKLYGAMGFPMFKYKDGNFEGGISKFITQKEKEALIKRFDLNKPAMLFFSVDTPDIVNTTLANMRKKIAADAGLVDPDALAFAWVTDFPLLEYHAEDRRFYAKHHPFTAPFPEHVPLLDTLKPEHADEVKAQAYDVVLNGSEIGGGSIRINNPDLQKKMFNVLGISDEEADVKFSFLVSALKYGAPPHGGIALGLDRILMLLLKRGSIREVIPFPKTQRGQCLMSGAPSPVDTLQLRELNIRVIEK